MRHTKRANESERHAFVNIRYLLPTRVDNWGKELFTATLAGDILLHERTIAARNIAMIQKELLRGNGLARNRWANPE